MTKYERLKSEFSKERLYKLLWQDNRTYRELQNKYNYSERLFSKLAKEYNIPKNTKAMAKHCKLSIDIEEIKDMYLNREMSTRQIAKQYGCQHSVISKRLKEHNISIRSAHSDIYYENRRKNYTVSDTPDDSGYILVRVDGREDREHRYVVEKHIGRELTSVEVVHHIDFDRANNNIDNLFLFENSSMHSIYHGYLNQNPFMHPKDFVETYKQIINKIFSYDYLYNQYIVENLSVNKITKNINNQYNLSISRTSITSRLKEYGLYDLIAKKVNQHD